MKKFLLHILLFLFSAVSVYSQTVGSVGASDARSMALGNEYTVTSNGVYSIGKNPANLATKFNHSFEIATILPLPNVNAISGSNFISVEDFNYFFVGNNDNSNELAGKELNNSDKQRLLNLFTSENRLHSKVSYTLFAISVYTDESIGAFAFNIHDQAAVTSNVPKDIMDLVLYGNQPGRVYDFSDAQFDAWVLRSYSLSYARDFSGLFLNIFKSFNAGITFKYIQGIAYASLDKSNTTLVSDANNYGVNVKSELILHSAISPDFGVTYDFEDGDKESNFTPFPEPAGSGFGFDLGVTSDINDRLRVGLSITDIGTVNWDTEAAEYAAATEFTLDDITEGEVVDSLFDTILGDGQFVDGYSTGLATAFHLGGSYQVGNLPRNGFPGILLITAGYHQGFNDLPGNSTNPRFALGAEWQLVDWFQLRSGISFGGRDEFNWAFGVGFDTSLLEFHIATKNLTGTLGSVSSRIISLSIGTRWKF